MRDAADMEEIARTRGYPTHNWNVSQLEDMLICSFITHLHERFDGNFHGDSCGVNHGIGSCDTSRNDTAMTKKEVSLFCHRYSKYTRSRLR
jgi:hypothetical protein